MIPERDSSTTAERALPWVLLGVMTLAYAGTFSWLAVMRHLAFQSHAFDLGNMDQAVWTTLHGMPLRFTDMQVGHSVLTSRFAIHFEPILIPMSLLYLLHAGPETLLVVQALVVASGAVPAYLLARSVLDRPWLSLVFPAAYVLHPSLQNALLDDFHAVTMSAALLLWAMYFLWVDRPVSFLLFGFLAAATKEEVALLVGLLGLALALRHRLLGIVVLVAGMAWFLAAFLLIIPHFNPGGHSPYLQRYAYLGHGFFGVLGGAVRHPDIVAHTLISRARLLYLDALLDPAGFVPLLGLPVLLLAVPTVLLNMLSADPTMYSGFYQYNAELVPYLVAGAIFGVAAAGRVARRARAGAYLPIVLGLLIVSAALAATYLDGFTPVSAGFSVPSAGTHQQVETALIGLVPPAAVVAAGDEIEPHLSDRRTIYLLPTVHPSNGPAAQYIVFDATIPSRPVQPGEVRTTFRWALRHGYGIRAARDGVVVLQRGVLRRHVPRAFYSFALTPPHHLTPVRVASGPLSLAGVTIHPGYGWINASRPAIEVESYWRASAHVNARADIQFAVTPLYSVRPPLPPAAASFVGDTPTLHWLPMSRWPLHRTVHVASLPLLPPVTRPGKVDVYVRVVCSPEETKPSCPVSVPPHRIGTITVRAPG